MEAGTWLLRLARGEIFMRRNRQPGAYRLHQSWRCDVWGVAFANHGASIEDWPARSASMAAAPARCPPHWCGWPPITIPPDG